MRDQEGKAPGDQAWRAVPACEVRVCLVGRQKPAPGTARCRQSAQSFELHVNFY